LFSTIKIFKPSKFYFMKTLLMSLALTLTCCALFAQVPTDTTNNNWNRDSSQMNTTPPNNMSDTSGNMNNSNMPSRNDTLNNGMTNDNMNQTQMNNGMVNNNRSDTSLLVNPMNTPGQPDYAALPVLETFVPDAVVATVKEKYGNELVYDITAVKAQVDSTAIADQNMSMNNSNSMNANQPMAQNSTTVDANAGNPSASVQNSTTMSAGNQTDSLQNSTTVNANATNPSVSVQNSTTMSANQPAQNQMNNVEPNSMSHEEHYNYIVRVIKNGTITNETVSADGNSISNGTLSHP
jgi:hypothetical protein